MQNISKLKILRDGKGDCVNWSEFSGHTLPVSFVGLTPDPVIVSIKMWPIAGVTAQDRSGVRRAGFITIGERACSSDGCVWRQAICWSYRIALGRLRAAVTVIVTRLPIGVAAVLVETATMCDRKTR